MLVVTFYGFDSQGNDGARGTLALNGRQWIVSPGAPWLNELIKNPIEVPVKGRMTQIHPQLDPEGFLNALHLVYNGTYLRASEPYETQEMPT